MAKAVKPTWPDHLRMELFDPGMSALHRAGLGGLACTLKVMERRHRADRLADDKLPGPVVEGEYPWVIDERSITLNFGKPEQARDYLKRLFEFAFDITPAGLIRLPGQYEGGNDPSSAILADLQLGVLLTFLQHGGTRKLEKTPTPVQFDTEGDGVPGVVVEYKKCSKFKHQQGWEELVDSKGRLETKPIKVDGPLSPGTVVRHVAFGADTEAKDLPARILPLYFAIVGCMPLSVNRGVGVLLVPEVENLEDFVLTRPAMTPTAVRESQIASAADGALQAQVRLRSRAVATMAGIPGCYAMTLRPTVWATQQKSRVATLHAPPGNDSILDRFNIALELLPMRFGMRTDKVSSGSGQNKVTTERKLTFRADSVVRPLIAENLALGRKWYSGFSRLMTSVDPATKKPFRKQLSYECGGLHTMISEDKMWDEAGERLLVQAVHEAMRWRRAQIRKDTDGTKAPLSKATTNRWERFAERLRIALAQAKREADVRFTLSDLFSRAGKVKTLQLGWHHVHAVIRKDWQLARDLGLLALASYKLPTKSTATKPTTPN
jgi:CRISPR-associated protein Cas8a1/Csx13